MVNRKKATGEFKYNGILARPVPWRGPAERKRMKTIVSADETPEEARRLDAEHDSKVWIANIQALTDLISKVDALFTTFPGTKKGDYVSLAFGLAMRHVPGFAVAYRKRKRGAKLKWTLARLRELHGFAEELRREKARPNSEIARALRRKKRYAHIAARTLENILSDADRFAEELGIIFTALPEIAAESPEVTDLLRKNMPLPISVMPETPTSKRSRG